MTENEKYLLDTVENINIRCNCLEAENDALRDEVRRLREQIGANMFPHRFLGLGALKLVLLGNLMSGATLSTDDIVRLCWAGRGQPPERKTVTVMISQMRAQLAHYGVEISSPRRGRYRLNAAARAKLNSMIGRNEL